MAYIAVDPGTKLAGLAIMDDGQLLHREQLDIGTSKDPLPQRIHALYDAVRMRLLTNKITAIVMEDSFIGKNRRTSMFLAMARGALMLLAAQNGIPAYCYPPSTVKLAVAHNGRAEKEAVQQAVREHFSIEGELGADEADAIAIAYTHHQHTIVGAHTVAKKRTKKQNGGQEDGTQKKERKRSNKSERVQRNG